MKKTLFIFFAVLFCHLYASLEAALNALSSDKKIVIATKRIPLEDYPGAFNPSIIRFEEKFLLTFRYCPDSNNAWLNQIGVVLLNDSFEQISEPQLLNTRPKNSKTPSQAEDARIFSYRGRLFLIYNDNVEIIFPRSWERRDMYMAELLWDHQQYTLSSPLKLVYEEKYHSQKWQKNWIPFEWNNQLLLSYTLNPHEVIYPNLMSGECYHCYDSWEPLNWSMGTLRGSTPPQLVDGEYLAFFHSAIIMASPASWGWEIWHYFMGAYTFSAEPPFQITKMTPSPIIEEGFYTPSNAEKRVIFPGGFVVSGPYIYLAYGKDDREVWIATLDKEALKSALAPIETN
jgi:predicted GH43/DUF377 family glycosyl hydrolase